MRVGFTYGCSRVRRLVAIAFAAPWVVWALVRVAGVEVPYPFVAALAFTPYAALSSPLPVIAGVLLRRWVVAGVAAVAAVALGLALLPRTVDGPEAAAQGPRLTVMTSNRSEACWSETLIPTWSNTPRAYPAPFIR